MHIHDYYYDAKPFLPWKLRMMARRLYVRGARGRSQDVWPISPTSDRLPANWPGWPEKKRFALVLTHDVEGKNGLSKCQKLMATEQRLGFRSCFNFIPEGEYQVPVDLQKMLVEHGFEVGVHDLYHDGKLYRTREGFRQKAALINNYLKQWGAVGFRSGFMHHNLDWMHDLRISYDTSTFDTDPFEPQPDGVDTIFPFWVPSPLGENRETPALAGSGYIELPYTLPQDSTLFLLLSERTIETWKRKLDWIACRGGMALLNVHPDYMSFDEAVKRGPYYPATLYTAFLEWVRDNYAGQYWHALPGQVAEYASGFKPRRPRLSRRICMVTHSFYKTDARVTRYAEALADRGDHVDVLALSRSSDSPAREKVGNVDLTRLQKRLGKNEKSRLGYLLPTLRFLVAAGRWITRSHRQHPYDLLHIHNVPDFLVFAGLQPRLNGVPIILDIHDIVPEFYASKFKKKEDSLFVTLLKWAERASARFASHVIIANHLWQEKYAVRTGSNGKCSVFINNVDTTIFKPISRTRADGKIQILFPGGLQWHQGLDIAIRAFKLVAEQIPNAEFHIYGDGNMKPSLMDLAKELHLEERVRFFDPLPVREIAEIMSNADLGVVPKRADSFGNEAYSTKIMEFMSVKVPVVVSSTRIDRYYFDDSVVRFFPSGDHKEMARQIVALLSDPEARQRQVENAFRYATTHSWDNRKHGYSRLVDSLIARRKRALYADPEDGAHVESPRDLEPESTVQKPVSQDVMATER